jgi:octaprenyl-diphosphate synthase
MPFSMFTPIFDAVKDDFDAVDRLISQSLSSEIPLVEEISSYIVQAGGKRLRPLLVLLAARASGYSGNDHIKLAVIIEFLHTAMLLHDDVVDNSGLRRGRATANATWGNAASVLVGDFLHSRAFEMMVEIGNLEVMGLLSKATNGIAEGEVQQLTYLRNADISEAMYFDVIYRKTALLFEVAAHSGAVLSGADTNVKIALQTYGKELGMAFQLMDDVLDYEGKTGDLGKNVGDDLAEGKVTLPLIVALASGNRDQQSLIRSAITDAAIEPDFEAIIDAVRLSGGIDKSISQAQQHRDLALDQINRLDASPFKTALSQLICFSVDRQT